MIKLGSVKIRVILGFLFALSVSPFLIQINSSTGINKHDELFSPALVHLNCIEKLAGYTDSLYSSTTSSALLDTAQYVKVSSDVIKRRFYHGLARYTYRENWIAVLAGKLLWSHLSAIVKPDDILKHQEGLCSQQTIVFLEILKRKGISFRTVGLGFKEGPGHFLSEVSYNGSWHLHDVTIEPKWENVANHHESLNYYLQNTDSLFLAYQGRLDREVFDKIMEKVKYGEVNEFPAKNMLLFHEIAYILTYFFPLLFLVMFIMAPYFKPKM